MDTHQRVSTRILWLVAVCSLVVMLGAPDVWAATHTYSGQATVVQATVLGVTTMLSDTGQLPSSGGALETSLLEAHVDGLLDAEVLHATTIGQGDQSRSEASVANLSLTVAGNTINADFLMARATAECQPGGPVVSGSSDIAVLVINGQTIAVTGQPNQTVDLLGAGHVVINEQTSDGPGAITVNALHVVVNGVADVVIAHAHADITCGGQAACTVGTDFVTGGGWITTPSSAKGTFGVAGGVKNGALWGHLTYIDHGTGMKVKGTGVTAYTGVDATTRRIDGNAEIDGQNGTYTVYVSDNGEPGRNDTFKIILSNGYTAGTVYLQGGNIQLHQPKCP